MERLMTVNTSKIMNKIHQWTIINMISNATNHWCNPPIWGLWPWETGKSVSLLTQMIRSIIAKKRASESSAADFCATMASSKRICFYLISAPKSWVLRNGVFMTLSTSWRAFASSDDKLRIRISGVGLTESYIP